MRPSLNAIRTFVVVAEEGSFTRAAGQLNVTQGAVSQQIAKLEDFLGLRLFERLPRGLRLTPGGQRFRRGVERGIDQIDAEIDALKSTDQSTTLRITANSSFAAQCLAPRLREFETLHPSIRLHCEATTRLVNYQEEGIDAGIRVGGGRWPGLTAHQLYPVKIFPVTTPECAAELDLENNLSELLTYPLLQDLDSPTEWKHWLAAAGLGDTPPNISHGFSDTLVTIRALLSGVRGIALIDDHLVTQELSNGSFVRISELALEPDYGYYLVHPVQRSENPALTEFSDWLLGIL